jgi:predicted HTH transcriptional regulator
LIREDALAVLESGEFGRFVGVEEDLEVEFKGEPYQLDVDSEKFELAKDTSALANARGGVLVIGIKTKRHAESPADVGDEIRLLTRDLVDEARYLDVIGDRIYPRIEGVRVRFFESATEADRGFVAIDVPPQEDRQKYFLIHRPIGEEGKTPGWLVGVAIRSFGRVDEQRIGELHTLVNAGLNVSQQLTEIQAAVARLHDRPEPEPAADSPADRLADVISDRLDELDR